MGGPHTTFKHGVKIEGLALRVYRIWYAQSRRAIVEYTFADFYTWWVSEYFKRKWKCAHVARKVFDGPYSFSNVEMQEQLDNNRERNTRCGNPGRTHKAVKVLDLKTGKVIKIFSTKVEAAKYYNVSEKTVYNQANGITKNPFQYGPKKYGKKVRFAWI